MAVCRLRDIRCTRGIITTVPPPTHLYVCNYNNIIELPIVIKYISK